MAEKRVLHEGEITLGDNVISCYVLEDGTRILSTLGMQRALGVVGNEPEQRSSKRLYEILSSKAVTRFVSDDLLSSKLSTISCYKGKQKITGYEATLLPEFCELMLRVRDYYNENKLQLGVRQKLVVAKSDILMRALARVGIIALVDEATGYQQDKDRAKDELQKFLSQFLTEEESKWVKTFNDSFFEMIYKMRGWNWITTGNRPGIVGQWINDIVYERLAPAILPELQRLNPKNEKGHRTKRHHQHLSDEVGKPKLKEHIAGVEALGRASGYDWNLFMSMLNRAYPRYGQQLDFIFPEQLSPFDQKLKTALDYNPKSNE